ncbi:hypothetical protein HME9304_01807 [Flagellimonas maritima]|uniref:Uncharacterized protein n=1 Tax=Flagellimonas maritima TaxID=1383885 RepID=A0A2Z4LSU8_9FLAO|nr:hypothetical protein HME9304_01807 [Allomuricauda aurantiaca]
MLLYKEPLGLFPYKFNSYPKIFAEIKCTPANLFVELSM